MKGISMKLNLCRMLSALALVAAFPLALCAQSGNAPSLQVTVATNANAKGIAIPSDFLGLSFETADTLPKSDGTYPYFRTSNHDLVSLFRTIGVRSLRIGGNTSDRPGVAVPDAQDIDQLFAFARTAGA